MLIVLGVAKLFATSLLLATGWKGGYIFPIMFASVALGLAVNLVFPHIPVAVTVAATMAGALVAALRSPLFCGALYVGPGAARHQRGGCRGRGCQRLTDRAAGVARCPPRCPWRAFGSSPGAAPPPEGKEQPISSGGGT